MSISRLVFTTLTIIASCYGSGIGHVVPAVKSFPIVRYAPFYNFPGVRSIHAVAPAVAPAPLLPAPLQAPVFPAPAPVFPAPAPVFPAPAPVFSAPAPVFSAPGPVFPAPSPVFPAHAFPAPAPANVFPRPLQAPVLPAPVIAPAVAQAGPYFGSFLPRISPFASLPQAALFTRAVPSLSAVPFSPIVRPVAAPAITSVTAYSHGVGPTPFVSNAAIAPPPYAVAKPFPLGSLPYQPYGVSPYANLLPAPSVRQGAWK